MTEIAKIVHKSAKSKYFPIIWNESYLGKFCGSKIIDLIYAKFKTEVKFENHLNFVTDFRIRQFHAVSPEGT